MVVCEGMQGDHLLCHSSLARRRRTQRGQRRVEGEGTARAGLEDARPQVLPLLAVAVEVAHRVDEAGCGTRRKPPRGSEARSGGYRRVVGRDRNAPCSVSPRWRKMYMTRPQATLAKTPAGERVRGGAKVSRRACGESSAQKVRDGLKGIDAGAIALTVLGGLPSTGGGGRGDDRGRNEARTLPVEKRTSRQSAGRAGTGSKQRRTWRRHRGRSAAGKR